MYDTIWQIIQAHDYHLADIAEKINIMWLEGQMTVGQRDELIALARSNATPAQEAPELQQQLEYLAARVTALEEKVEALETGQSGETGGEAVYENWAQPIAGLTDKYQQGAIVRHNGVLWQSAYPGQNVWEPGVLGTELWWVKYTQEG